jgi:hypothetical protein
MLPALPPEFAATRHALHAVAEQVVAAAYWHATTRIGLRPSPRGFATPVFGDRERVRVDATALVHEQAGGVRRHELTTLAAAASFVGVPLGAPTIYPAATTVGPDVPLAIDRDGALALADWYALGAVLLNDLRAAHADVPSTELQIWPEHFDLACELGHDGPARANYGASPGDESIPEPYLYVGPHDPERRTGPFARCGFGAAFTYSELRQAVDPGDAGHQFFESALEELAG